MNFDIVQRVELPSKVVVEQDSRVVWRSWVDRCDRGGARTAARVDEEKVSIVRPCASVRHLDVL